MLQLPFDLERRRGLLQHRIARPSALGEELACPLFVHGYAAVRHAVRGEESRGVDVVLSGDLELFGLVEVPLTGASKSDRDALAHEFGGLFARSW